MRVAAVLSLLSLSAYAGAPTPPNRAEATYKQLELFARVLSYVQNNYVEQVDEQALMHGAIKGMLETLDPHTQFMPPDIFKEMKRHNCFQVATGWSSAAWASRSPGATTPSWWWRPSTTPRPSARASRAATS